MVAEVAARTGARHALGTDRLRDHRHRRPREDRVIYDHALRVGGAHVCVRIVDREVAADTRKRAHLPEEALHGHHPGHPVLVIVGKLHPRHRRSHLVHPVFVAAPRHVQPPVLLVLHVLQMIAMAEHDRALVDVPVVCVEHPPLAGGKRLA